MLRFPAHALAAPVPMLLLLLLLLLTLAGALTWRVVHLTRALRRAQADKQQAQGRLALERERWQLAQDAAGGVLWMIDVNSLALSHIGDTVERVLGYSVAEAEAIYRLPADYHIDGPLEQMAPRLAQRIRHFLAGDMTRRQLVREYELRRKDGTPVAVEVVSTLVADAAGIPTALVGVLRDISARRRQEQEQQRFIGMLSHEFRTPLATIDGAIQRLETRPGAADPATRKRYRNIQTAVDRLIALLDEFLSPDRMASIGRKQQVNRASPAALLEEAAAKARSPLHPIQVMQVEAGALPASVRCDPEGMRLALNVLIDNACKYTPDGSAIELVGRRAGDGGIELLVRDHGAGILADESAHLFDKFFRGRGAGQQTGSGLGLYMARAVVEVHGGTLTVCNRAQGGAQFRIWLPYREPSGKSLASGRASSDNSIDEHASLLRGADINNNPTTTRTNPNDMDDTENTKLKTQ
jgi:two-component system, OmpR family, phosphate regulon sensor histidine kinase PhoR